jgi:hypothetical protein
MIGFTAVPDVVIFNASAVALDKTYDIARIRGFYPGELGGVSMLIAQGAPWLKVRRR